MFFCGTTFLQYMKKLILVIGSLFIGQLAIAQLSLDPEVGLNISNISSKTNNGNRVIRENKIGFNIGAGFNIPIYKGLYFKPGLQYTILGDKENLPVGNTISSYHYLRLPINMGYRISLPKNSGALFFEAGPYLGFGLSGTTKTENLPIVGTVERAIEFGKDINEANPLDFGINLGLGYETPFGLYFKANNSLGIANISNASNYTAQHRVWNFNVGYRIKL